MALRPFVVCSTPFCRLLYALLSSALRPFVVCSTPFCRLFEAIIPACAYCRTHARLLPHARSPIAVRMHAYCRALCGGRHGDAISAETGVEYGRNERWRIPRLRVFVVCRARVKPKGCSKIVPKAYKI